MGIRLRIKTATTQRVYIVFEIMLKLVFGEMTLFKLQMDEIFKISLKTLTDVIFSNFISHEIISGNIIATTSDHLPQLSSVPNIPSNPSTQKSNFCEKRLVKI